MTSFGKSFIKVCMSFIKFNKAPEYKGMQPCHSMTAKAPNNHPKHNVGKHHDNNITDQICVDPFVSWNRNMSAVDQCSVHHSLCIKYNWDWLQQNSWSRTIYKFLWAVFLWSIRGLLQCQRQFLPLKLTALQWGFEIWIGNLSSIRTSCSEHTIETSEAPETSQVVWLILASLIWAYSMIDYTLLLNKSWSFITCKKLT